MATGANGAGRLTGKVALVTGAARGIGAATAELFVREGARVVLADIAVDAGAALAESLGDHATFVSLDVRDETAWDTAVAAAEKRFGGLDVLVNNAGIYFTSPIAQMTREMFVRLFEVNQLGVFLGMRAALPAMQRRGGGSIVSLSSTSGMKGNQNSIGSGSTKWALRGMTKVAAVEFGEFGIRVNSVHPGIIDTPMNHEEMGAERIVEVGKGAPLGRHGTAAEVADLILYLASDDASYVSGGEFTVDGGMMAGTRRAPFRPRG